MKTLEQITHHHFTATEVKTGNYIITGIISLFTALAVASPWLLLIIRLS